MWERAQLSFIILPRFSPFFTGFMSEFGREVNQGPGEAVEGGVILFWNGTTNKEAAKQSQARTASILLLIEQWIPLSSHWLAGWLAGYWYKVTGM